MKWLVIVACLIASNNFAQIRQFSGVVKQKDSNELLAGITIQLIETGEYTKTNQLGEFQFNGVLLEKVSIRCVGYGFESQVLFVDLTQNQNLEVLLVEKHLDLEEVTISSGIQMERNSNPFHIETRKLSELNGIVNTNIGEALAKIPGVYQSSLGNGISKPVIRGLQGMRVVSLINGLRIEGQQWGGDHGMGMAELGIGSVEVIKGPASLLYGADALGGVIYYADELYAPTNSNSLNVQTVYNSNTNGGVGRFLYKQSGKKLRWLLGGSYGNNADFQLPNKKYAQNSRFSEAVVKVAVSWNWRSNVSHLRYSYNHVVSGIPGHTHDTIVNPLDFQVDIQRRQQTIPAQFFDNHYLSFENKYFKKKNEISVLLGQTLNQLTEYDEKVTIPGIQMNLWNTIANVKWNRELNNKMKLLSGLQSMFQQNRNGQSGTEQLLPNSITSDFGIFSNWLFEMNNWNFQAGVRYDVRILKTLETFKGNVPLTRLYHSPNLALGAVYSKKMLVLRTNLSSGFRAPHPSELLANGFHHGALRYEIGDINLKAEKALQLDVTAEIRNEHVSLIMNPFSNLISNFIYIQPADSVINGLPVFYYRQMNQVLFYGSDLGIHYHPHFAHNLHLETTFSWIKTIASSSQGISLIPPARLLTSLRYDFKWGKKVQLKDVLVQNTFVAKQDEVALNETPSPFYNVLNASLTILIDGKSPFTMQLGCKNLLNAQFIDHLSRLKNIEMPNPGRNIYLSLSFNLSNNFKIK